MRRNEEKAFSPSAATFEYFQQYLQSTQCLPLPAPFICKSNFVEGFRIFSLCRRAVSWALKQAVCLQHYAMCFSNSRPLDTKNGCSLIT